MQLQGKLMNKTWENDEERSLGPILACLAQIWVEKKKICGFYFYYILDIVESYHCMQFYGKPMNQAWENDEKPNFGMILVQIWPFKNIFDSFTSTRYHCMQLLRKIMNKTWENGENWSLACLAQIWAPMCVCMCVCVCVCVCVFVCGFYLH